MRYTLALVLALLAYGSFADENPQFIKTGSHFWKLELNEPAVVVTNFIDAYRSQDFATMFYLLHGTTHLNIQKALQFFQPDRMINNPGGALIQLESMTAPGNNFRNIVFYFDQIMAYGRKHNSLPVDFNGVIKKIEYTDKNNALATISREGEDSYMFVLKNCRTIVGELKKQRYLIQILYGQRMLSLKNRNHETGNTPAPNRRYVVNLNPRFLYSDKYSPSTQQSGDCTALIIDTEDGIVVSSEYGP